MQTAPASKEGIETVDPEQAFARGHGAFGPRSSSFGRVCAPWPRMSGTTSSNMCLGFRRAPADEPSPPGAHRDDGPTATQNRFRGSQLPA
jgi:hypothetical protein